jgi:hypothetical protein
MMFKRNIILSIILFICGICILLSQNFGSQGNQVLDMFDWTSYYIDDYGYWVHVSFQDSIIAAIPGLGYFPTIVAGLVLAGGGLAFGTVRGAKILCLVSGILTIVGFILYLLPTFFLQMIGSYVPFPNEIGAYFYIVPGIMALILAFLFKKAPEMGYAKEEKDYYAIGGEIKPEAYSQPSGPRIQCPKCGAFNPAGATFCDNCGEYL